MENTLSVREVASIFRVHKNSVKRWSNQGIIRSYRVGPHRERRFKIDDITRYLAKCEENRGNLKINKAVKKS